MKFGGFLRSRIPPKEVADFYRALYAVVDIDDFFILPKRALFFLGLGQYQNLVNRGFVISFHYYIVFMQRIISPTCNLNWRYVKVQKFI